MGIAVDRAQSRIRIGALALDGRSFFFPNRRICAIMTIMMIALLKKGRLDAY